MNTKVCTKCKVEKDISEFPVNKGQCKACKKEYMKNTITKSDFLNHIKKIHDFSFNQKNMLINP